MIRLIIIIHISIQLKRWLENTNALICSKNGNQELELIKLFRAKYLSNLDVKLNEATWRK